MYTIDKLKKNSKNGIDKLSTELNKFKGPQTKDARFWYPDVDKSGNGYAVIRFLPPADENSPQLVRQYTHSFQGPTGQWYIETDLSTFGLQDPCSEYNSKLWQTGIEANKEQVRVQKRKETYISNIYVVNDTAHPENNGKVFLFRYGKKIFDKVNGAAHPEFPDDPKVDPFNVFEGADFKIKIRTEKKFRNYDSSVFENPKSMVNSEGKSLSDKEIVDIVNQTYSLNEFLDASKYKDYQKLKERLDLVLQLSSGSSKSKSSSVSDDEPPFVPDEPKATVAPTGKTKAAVAFPETDNEDDDSMALFRSLAEDE